MAPPLSGFRVVDLSTWIGGAYCTKLLADGGAEVIKVESPEGDPLRRWSASGAAIPSDEDGALFNFLGASKRSVVVDGTEDRRPRRRCTHCCTRPTPSSGRGARRWRSRPRWTPGRCCAPIRTWSSRRSRPSGSTVPGATGRPPSSRCRPGPGASSGWRAGSPTVRPCSSVDRSGSGSPASTAPSGRWPPVDAPRPAARSSTSPCSRRWRCASPITR